MTLFQLLLSRSPWKGFASFGRIMLSFSGTLLPRYRNAVAGFTRDEDIVHMPGGVIIISPAPNSTRCSCNWVQGSQVEFCQPQQTGQKESKDDNLRRPVPLPDASADAQSPLSQAMLNADSRQIGWNWPSIASMSSRQHQLGQVEITIARTITASSKNAPAARQRRVQALEFRSPQLNRRGQSSSAPRDWIFAACHVVEIM